MADWSQLPKELLHLISERLDSALYLLRFRSVCSTWRSSISNHHHHHHLPFKFPLLSNTDSNNNASTFSLSKRTLFLITPPSHQTLRPWLIKIGQDSRGRTHLWHPLSRDPPISLLPHVLDFNHLRVSDLGPEFVLGHSPPLSPNTSLYMEKVVAATWQGKQQGPDFALLTIHVSGKLALFRSGDDRWTVIPDMPAPYDDVCIFRGRPCAVDGTGRTVAVRPDSTVELVAEPVFGGDKKLLVESNGELLLVDKYLSSDCFCSVFEDDDDDDGDDYYDGEIYGVGWERAVRFDVFRLEEKEKRWVELTSLGDRVLFLGDDCAFSASASDLCVAKGNCVIFRDDSFGGVNGNAIECGMRVFHLDQGRISPLSDYPGYSELFWPIPDWIGSH